MDHQARLHQETEWYSAQKHNSRHLLNRWPLFSQARNDSAYAVAKSRLFEVAQKSLAVPKRILVAPCGSCADYPFIRSVWPQAELVGLDIAPQAVPEKTIVGDILNMQFADGAFDLAISNLFFHHIADEGFAPYLKELRRVAPRLITLEPSRLHPFSFLTRPAIRIFGNITGQVPHEHPISLNALECACADAGYSRVETFACSFAHNRIPAPIRPVLNVARSIPQLKHLAWLFGLIAE